MASLSYGEKDWLSSTRSQSASWTSGHSRVNDANFIVLCHHEENSDGEEFATGNHRS